MKLKSYAIVAVTVAMIVAIVSGAGRWLSAQTLTLASSTTAELTVSADKTLITIHRALDVDTVLCIERQPAVMWSYGSNLVLTPADTAPATDPQAGVFYAPPATPKADIAPRICMTVEKWLVAGDK